MREIKFRAYDPDLKQWYYAELTPNLGWEVIEKSSRESKHTTNDNIKDWQQYTGLKDKNGVEIYEGDIVRNNDGITGEMKFYTDGSSSSFSVESIAGKIYENTNELEVIGNTWEKPELLK